MLFFKQNDLIKQLQQQKWLASTFHELPRIIVRTTLCVRRKIARRPLVEQAAGTNLRGKSQRQIARATGDVEHRLALAHIGYFDGIGLPDAMQSGRHQVVHDVVFGRHRVKNATHTAGFFLLFDGFKSKMGLAHVLNAQLEVVWPKK